jgi:hypothetical protein
MVSDGCSSSEDTDFGSRILCKAAESAIKLLHSGEIDVPLVRPLDHVSNIANSIASNVLESYGRMLTPYALDCTLLVAYRHSDAFHVIATGDGVVAARRNDGTLDIRVIEYAGNAPIYMNYLNNQERLDGLRRTFDCTKRIYFLSEDGQDTHISKNIEEYYEFPFSEYSSVAVMTDGVLSFKRLSEDEKSYERVDVQNIVSRLMSFDQTLSGFIERQCKDFRFDCSLLHMIHKDDVAIGALTK